MSHPLTRPPIAPHGWAYATGPGPLSPAWPQPSAPTPPDDDLLVLAVELRALQRACLRSLDPNAGTGPLVLGLGERAQLNKELGRLKELNAELPRQKQSMAAAAWGEPVLPEGVLVGARDLIGLLEVAAGVAGAVAEDRRCRRVCEARETVAA